jgi:hemerythrin-like domain-containing protein
MASTQKVNVPGAPRIITPTLEEHKASAYDISNIESALEALNQDGFVVLKKVVDVAHVNHLNSFMTKEADELVKNNTKPFNQGVDCMYKPTNLGNPA